MKLRVLLSGRVLVVLSAIALLVVVVIGIGVYGLVRGPAEADTSPGRHIVDIEDTSAESDTPTSTATAPSPLPRTTDPVRYARAVAEAIFSWDTMSGLVPADYASIAISDADPSGYETNGLVADLSGYLPTDQTWQQLRTYRVTQTLTVERAYVPTSWPEILASAGDRLEAGTVAVTIEGTRRRAGVWYGQPETADHAVSFTVFMACPPTFDRCHVLRLSELDNPLT